MQFKLGEPALTWWGTTKLYVKRVLMAVGLVIFGPIALLFLLPFGLCYLFIEKTKQSSIWARMNLFLRIIYFILLFPLVLAVGIIAGIISVPLSIIVGIPGFIIKEIWDKIQTKKAAKKKLLDKL
jgi:hypothetical protein